jgi:GPH family glycoside/pentoside/hexuronide:cation symporter
MISLIPAAFAFLAVAVMLFYKLDNQQMAEIRVELARRKAAEPTASSLPT